MDKLDRFLPYRLRFLPLSFFFFIPARRLLAGIHHISRSYFPNS